MNSRLDQWIKIKMHRKQIGIALISTLLVVSIAAYLMTQLISEQKLNIEYALKSNTENQILLYHFSVESVAIQAIKQSYKRKHYDYPGAIWDQEFSFPIDDFIFAVGAISSAQTLLNINNLHGFQIKMTPSQSPSSYTASVFERMFQDYRFGDAKALVYVMVDWIDDNNDVTTSEGARGAENSTYYYLTPPYGAGNQMLSSIHEAGLFYRFNQPSSGSALSAYDVLLQYAQVFPESNVPINVNMLPCDSGLWYYLFEGINDLVIDLICINDLELKEDQDVHLGNSEINTRQPYTSRDDFFSALNKSFPPSSVGKSETSWTDIVPRNMFTVSSDFYQLHVDYLVFGCTYTITSLIKRKSANAELGGVVVDRRIDSPVCQ